MAALIWVIGLAAVLFVFVLVAHVMFYTTTPEYRVMSPAEEAKYELHPTVTPYTTEITAENVKDIINLTIEDGVEHPALALRKAQA